MKYKIIAKLDEQKYKSCKEMDSNLWPKLKDKVYTLGVWPTRDWAEWSAQCHRDYQFSNLDTSTVEVIEID